MPVCEGCGSSFDGSFQFCPHCGRAKPVNVSASEEPFTWEYCQIVFDGKSKQGFFKAVIWRDVRFWADAVGRKGRYNAGESPHYDLDGLIAPLGESKKDRLISGKALTSLVNKLVSEGWEPTQELGPNSWNQKFRRRVTG